MAQEEAKFTPEEKRHIIDALAAQMQVTARAAKAANDKGLNSVANAYHQANAATMLLKAKAEKTL